MLRRARMILVTLLLSTAAAAAWPQALPTFSGVWKQDNDRCLPRRNGDVTLRIERKGSQLTVETSISRPGAAPRHAVQKYTTDGKTSISTGADGDEFHTSVVPQGASLVFSVEEHEDGRILLSKETWTVIDGGAALERLRERADGEKQTLIYRRAPETAPESKPE